MISGAGTPGYPGGGVAGPGTNSGAAAPAGGAGMDFNSFSMAAGGITAVGSIMTGLMGYFAGQNMQDVYESRARMLRRESEAEATRYEEQAGHFKATQKLAFLKSGVQLSGSPLDILDETIRVGHENASAIRASGAARALDAQMGGEQAAMAGRNALVSGVTGAAQATAKTAYSIYRNEDLTKSRKDTPTGY